MVASYPFDDSASHMMQGYYSSSVDDNLFKHLALTYAKNHPVMRTGEPKCPDTPDETFEDGIVNGAKWYDVPGKTFSSLTIRPLIMLFGEQRSCSFSFLVC